MITLSSGARVPHIEESKCRVCKRCVAREACRTKAILTLDPEETPFIDGSRCHGCMVCIPVCPFKAVIA